MEDKIKFLKSGILSPIKRWGTKWSLWAVHLVTACCGVELAHAYACGFDAERWGSLNYGMMRQTNLIIVEGAITRKMAKALRMTWEQMPEPKFVIVMGACGIDGGIFWNSYHLVRPSEVVPVDYFVPGCPPTPEGLIKAIRLLQNKIITGEAKPGSLHKEANLAEVLGVKEPIPAPKRPAISPVRITPKPEIKIVPKEVDWEFGKKLVENLNEKLEGLAESIMITDVNRIYIKTTKEKFREIAEKIKWEFDHVKSVNVIDVPHENKFIVEYVVSSYSVKEYMPVLITIAADIPRDNPEFPSMIDIWPSCDYLEREIHDFFGVIFKGNPNMERNFLLAPDTPKYPLRKDFKIEQPTFIIGGEKSGRS